MNTILLQKILDILTEGLAHVGDFFKDLFVSDPQDGQVIGYDGATGEWKNMDIAELSFDITHTSGPADPITISDAAADMLLKSLTVDIVPQQASGTPTPETPLPISGSDEIVITHTYGDNITDTHTIALPSTVYGGEVDAINGKLVVTHVCEELGSLTWNLGTGGASRFVANPTYTAKAPTEATIQADVISDIFKPVSAKTIYYGTDDYEIAIHTNGAIWVRDTDYTDKDAFKTAMANHYIVYELETPIEIVLTPTTIKTKGGTETFAVDANEMEMEYYTSTAGTIKSLVSITDDITSEITKNTTDFSDILLKVSRNNKVVSVEIYSATTAAAVNETFLSNLPKPAMNCKVLLVNTTLGEDGTILGTLKTTGELEITTPGAKTFSGLITYVVK